MARRKIIKTKRIKRHRGSKVQKYKAKKGKKKIKSIRLRFASYISRITPCLPAGRYHLSRLSLRPPIVLVFSCSSVLVILAYFFIFNDLPSPKRLTSQSFPVSTQILDRNGKLLYEIYAEQKRTPIKLEDLPDHVKQATIAIEDKNFYKHHGFDFRGWIRASFNIVFKRKLQGGSTITQQLIKNTLLTPERTVRRKMREFVLALAVEVIYSKDQILQMYLNQAPYGSVAYGIEAAAQTYFDKQAKDLSLAEAALLAGLPAAPTRYSPFGAYPEAAKNRQQIVLGRMVADKYINQKEMSKAKEEELNFAHPKTNINAPHFVMFVKNQLVEKYGQQVVEQGGLRVTTTLDLEMQEFAQETVATEVTKLEKQKVSNGAALVTNPKTGDILAMVGSKDYFGDQTEEQDVDLQSDDDSSFTKPFEGKVNVTTALRQPGSAIKPLNYALAFMNHKITPSTVINDMPTCFLVTGQKPYCPDNYDLTFHGPTQVRFTLGSSYNLPAVKVLALNGLEDFIATASAFGITTFKDPKDYGLSLTLGGGEVKMIDMATAFGVFANLGERIDLVSILKVENYQGNVLEENSINYSHGAGSGSARRSAGQQSTISNQRVIPMEVAYLISHILLDNNARSPAFGSSSWLVVKGHPEVAVKTGTTNDRRDNWTIGYNQDILVATWVGNNDNSPMSYVASGVTGASPIWNKIITHALEDSPQTWPIKPEKVIGTNVCWLSGIAQGDSDCPARFEYFLKGAVPSTSSTCPTCPTFTTSPTSILINKTTNQPVQPGELQLIEGQDLPEWVEYQDHQIITDPLGTIFCLDCTPPPPEITPPPTQIRYPLKSNRSSEIHFALL